MLIQPESPRWLLRAGRKSDALKVLSRIRKLPDGHPYLAWEVQTVEDQLEHELQNRSGQSLGLLGVLRELKISANRTRLLLGMTIMILQNLVSVGTFALRAEKEAKNRHNRWAPMPSTITVRLFLRPSVSPEPVPACLRQGSTASSRLLLHSYLSVLSLIE